MKKLPIGISTLANIRNDNYLYIDKSPFVKQLVDHGKYYFLSRPRRFGKSLFVDTLKQAFSGNKAVFEGLYLENHWDWDIDFPVVHFSFGGGSAYGSEQSLLAAIWRTLKEHAAQFSVTLEAEVYSEAFQELITKVAVHTGKPLVILVDEYDKPILDVLQSPQEAAVNREILKGLYSVIKDNDKHLKFVLLTGVSKFSKVSLFSGLNNLDDISLDPRFCDVCGYTQAELEHHFADYIADGKVDLAKLKRWYNGYNFAGSEDRKVYNPFDILLFCSKKYQYKNYWFETATPSFLVKLIEQKGYYIPRLENYVVSDESLSSFDIETIPLQTLLFQTGYLTIKEQVNIGTQYGYVLTYPNLEVKASLNAHLMQLGSTVETRNYSLSMLSKCLQADDFDELKPILERHFASIPHDWFRHNAMGQYEGFYASVVYSCFAALGYEVTAEDTTSLGQIDMTVEMPDKVLVVEFKLNTYGSASDALAQIKNKHYAKKYSGAGRAVYLIGMSFDVTTRTVDGLEIETA